MTFEFYTFHNCAIVTVQNCDIMKSYKLYVGHCNETKEKFEEKYIASLVGKFFDSFSIYACRGYYKGTPEESYKIEILTTEEKKVDELKNFLVKELDQESVLKVSDLQKAEF